MALVWILGMVGCDPGEHREVLIVVNARSSISVAIGDYYRLQRDIPARNVVSLGIELSDPGLGDEAQQTVSREDYRQKIHQPIQRFLRERDLVEQIEIIVTTKGVPLRVSGPRVPVEDWLRDATMASVDAELSLLFSPWEGSRGVADSANPYFDSSLAFRRFRRVHPNLPPHYLVARLTGYQSEVDPETGVPRDVKALIDAAQAKGEPGVWLIDEDPSLEPGLAAGNRVLLRPAAAALRQLGLDVYHDRDETFVSDAASIRGYASWGSNDGHDAGPPTYGRIEGRRYPGSFTARALAVDFVSTNARSFTHPPSYGQSLVADLVRGGVAGAAGNVYEPALPGVPRPHILLRRYAQGVMAIEAFYRSIPYLGWTSVYIGDPLMQIAEPISRRDPDDLDGDGRLDREDNCVAIPNPRQRDTNGDGYGNLCDADITNDGIVTTSWGDIFPITQRGDIEWIALAAKSHRYDPDSDLDGDGDVDEEDLSIAQLSLFLRPGPSGVAISSQ